MKRKVFLVLLIIIFQFLLVACSSIDDSDYIDLYSAYKRDGNSKRWGYINHEGDFLIDPIYDLTIDFNKNGLGKVYKKNKLGFINTDGEEIIPIEFDELDIVDDDIIRAEKNEKYFIFDENGKELFSSSEYSSLGSYSENTFIVEKELDNGIPVMGFIDKSGKEIIEPKYEKVYNFNQGKAVVKMEDSKYAIINKFGNIIEEYDYNYIVPNQNSDKYLVVDDENQYGYLDRNGNLIIEPQFTIGSSFEDGYAKVTKSDLESESKLWGIIDENGEYVIQAKYTNIIYLGEDLFAVSKDKLVTAGSTNLTKHAIITREGKLLTGYSYYNIGGNDEKVQNGMVSVYDGENTYILDPKGNRIEGIPEITGYADIKFDGNMVQVLVDNRLHYYNRNKELVWKEDNSFILNNGGLVEEKKYTPNKQVTIFYPKIEQLEDKELEDKINGKLYNKFITESMEDIKDEDNNMTLKVVYSINSKEDILTIRKSSYEHRAELTKGISKEDIYYINLQDGTTQRLDDLFKEGSNYIGRLNNIVREKMEDKNDKELETYNIDEFETISQNQSFTLGNQELKIYFHPSEISEPEENIPSFTIAYEDIEDIIDEGSKLWDYIKKSKGN